jgi:hypothetical protein
LDLWYNWKEKRKKENHEKKKTSEKKKIKTSEIIKTKIENAKESENYYKNCKCIEIQFICKNVHV